VSIPKGVTVFIFCLFFFISLTRTKIDWCKFVLVISLRSKKLMIQKFVHLPIQKKKEICAFKIMLI